eukprot:499326-Hanusia_phi.AAC.3
MKTIVEAKMMSCEARGMPPKRKGAQKTKSAPGTLEVCNGKHVGKCVKVKVREFAAHFEGRQRMRRRDCTDGNFYSGKVKDWSEKERLYTILLEDGDEVTSTLQDSDEEIELFDDENKVRR